MILSPPKYQFIIDDWLKKTYLCSSKLGVGVAMTRDPATLMVGQYFKRKRELVEIFLVSGSGLGIATMSVFIKTAIR